MTPRLDPEALRPFAQSGPRTITGEAFLRLPSGRLVHCDGAHVVLLPAVPAVDEAMAQWRAGGAVDLAGAPALDVAGAARWTECNSRGTFAFSALPARDYWVAVPVRWQETRRKTGLTYGYGGMLAMRVSVRTASRKGIVVDNEDAHFAANPRALAFHMTSRCGCALDELSPEKRD